MSEYIFEYIYNPNSNGKYFAMYVNGMIGKTPIHPSDTLFVIAIAHNSPHRSPVILRSEAFVLTPYF